jgi:hypothetical protein
MGREERGKGGNGRPTGVPKPETASQPVLAGKPVVLQPRAEPLTISVNAAEPTEYSHGFRKPRTGFPAASKASLTSEMMEDAVGAAALFILSVRIQGA